MIGLLLAISMLPSNAVATSCDPTQYMQFKKYADWIFIGTVVEARQLEDAPRHIKFVVTDLERIRGNPPDTLELLASTGDYEAKITIAERYIVYVNSAERTVGSCRGFHVYDTDYYFSVLLMRQKGSCGTDRDRLIAVHSLRHEILRNQETPPRLAIEEMLQQYQYLNPNLEVVATDNKIMVKGIEFLFDNDVLAKIESGKCAA